ncbi:MAG: hypothetical protein K0R59_1035 [Sphingobacterium sp.]|jgi:hypothetical protein|nr:hypothetical protein [Sphingobacterium sp.]
MRRFFALKKRLKLTKPPNYVNLYVNPLAYHRLKCEQVAVGLNKD